MLIKETGTRGVIFTFDDDISIYLIKAERKYVLCDTHLGPGSMEIVKEYIAQNLPEKEILVFNSHSDWDHVWGNCAFKGASIIAHEKARTRMQEIGDYELNRLKKFHNGKIELKLPNLTFSQKLTLEDEEIEFIYSPGHTEDSALCFDRKDSVLYVGDLVENPIPYLAYYDLEAFINSLERIKQFPAKVKLSAHSGIITNELIEQNLSYIKSVLSGDFLGPEVHEYLGLHNYNLNNRLLLSYEPLIREKLGSNFDYATYKSNFMNLENLDYEDLKKAIEGFIEIL